MAIARCFACRDGTTRPVMQENGIPLQRCIYSSSTTSALFEFMFSSLCAAQNVIQYTPPWVCYTALPSKSSLHVVHRVYNATFSSDSLTRWACLWKPFLSERVVRVHELLGGQRNRSWAVRCDIISPRHPPPRASKPPHVVATPPSRGRSHSKPRGGSRGWKKTISDER